MYRVLNFDLLLTEPEKEAFSHYEDDVEDRSLSSKLLRPFWEMTANLVPATVAPNVLSLAGLLCTVQAFYLCFRYMDSHPSVVTVFAALLVFAYHTLDALDGIQATRTRNASPVGALWDQACDNVAIVFVALVGCHVLGMESDYISQWYIVQFFSLALLLVHLDALPKRKLLHGLLSGPGEAILVFEIILLSSAFFGRAYLFSLWSSIGSIPLVPWLLRPAVFYYAMVVTVVWKALVLPAKYADTRRGIFFCLLFRVAPAVVFYLGWLNDESLLNVICDGLFVSVISTDLVVSKMSGRNLHPWIWVFAMASVFSYMAILIVMVGYYSILFVELTFFLKLPMFTLAVNVYVDGVYDLLHLGHLNVFQAALQHGNRLFVGVLSDEAVEAYKRRPVMTMDERAAVVAVCKGVFKVIKNAPCPGIPMEFIKEHNIHVVCLSTEYDKPDDIYYAVPRKLGMTRVLPRTSGISTSQLIKRIKDYGNAESKQYVDPNTAPK